MNSPPPTDRDAIFARRALFISTAIAGLACTGKSSSSHGNEAKDPSGGVAQIERGGGDEGQTPPPGPEGPTTHTPWAEVMAEAPSLDVPAEGLSSRERALLELHAKTANRDYDKLRELWETVPACGADEDDCAVWAELIAGLEPYYDDVAPGGCDSASGVTGTVAARRAAHARFRGGLIRQLEHHFNESAMHYGTASAASWRQALAEARAPKPMPCLSPCPLPTFRDIVEVVPFAQDSAALDETEAAVKLNLDDVLQQARASAGATIVIRGHADPSEANPGPLAKQRAEAVRTWLVEAGVDADMVEVQGLGAELTIERGEAGLEQNPRVDFDLIPPKPGKDKSAQP